MVKRGFYDKIMPISEVMKMMQANEIKKVIVGCAFLYYTSKQTGEYFFSNRLLVNENQLTNLLTKNKIEYSSPIIDESHVAYALAIGLYSYFCYKLIMKMKDMHSYSCKQNKDIHQKERTFKDIGGCDEAKRALAEIIDYIKFPEDYRA
mmetsp:Transcript_37526/g.36079  ORF Transcript_37526/g.36079 Transcript_37526/m.36079 type:complete len:149 (+) Transcript_37526:145-591(+)